MSMEQAARNHVEAKPNFTYNAICRRVIDGDTLDVEIDVGFRMYARMPLRVAHIDAPEAHTTQGKLVTEYVMTWMGMMPRFIVVRTYKPIDKYGRYLAEVFCEGKNLATDLLAAGLVSEYPHR